MAPTDGLCTPMVKGIICDMDGVLYRGKTLIPGANDFVQRMRASGMPFIFLTNATESTQTQLRVKLEQRGIGGLSNDNFVSASMVTAMFLRAQRPQASAYVIGESGLFQALTDSGIRCIGDSDETADYVVVGKTVDFHFSHLKRAVRLIDRGAKFIGTNPDLVDPMDDGNEPACGALLAAIASASGKQPYIVGKPNALMMTLATRRLGIHPDDAAMIGDRMDTDILGGLEAGMTTCLVLSGVSTRNDLHNWAWQPDCIFDSVADIDPLLL